MEIGAFSQFFTLPYETFGHLTTIVTVVQLKHVTEPCGIHMRPASTVTWIPEPLTPEDLSLMEIATTKYNNRGSAMINQCWLHVQMISIMDLLIYDKSNLQGEIPPLRTSIILWPSHPSPPKHFWQLWTHFLHTHIKPLISQTGLQWNRVTTYRYSPSFYKHHFTPHPYQLNAGILTRYPI